MIVDGIEFSNLVVSRHSGRWHSRSICGQYFLKIQNLDIPCRQTWNLEQTDFIMRALHVFHCQSVPRVYGSGYLKKSVSRKLPKMVSGNFYYQITEFVNPLRRARRGDLVFSLLELARRGVFPNDIKKNNLGWKDSKLFILDFDQSILINANFKTVSSKELIESLNKMQIESVKFPIFSIANGVLNRLFTRKLFTKVGQLRLTSTTRFRKQLSTRNRHNNYHKINTKFLFAPGSREISSRKKILDSYKLKNSVLDFGANLGLIAQHVEGQAKTVHAYEIDKFTSSLGQTIMNIERSKVRFLENFPSERSDTIFLFSVLQHISNLSLVAPKLDKISTVLLIENRMKESGKVIHSRRTWESAESWNFETMEQLEAFLLKLFPLKKRLRVLGESDKGRFIFELY